MGAFGDNQDLIPGYGLELVHPQRVTNLAATSHVPGYRPRNVTVRTYGSLMVASRLMTRIIPSGIS